MSHERPFAIAWGLALLVGALCCRAAAADDAKPATKTALQEQAVADLEAWVEKHEPLVAHAETARQLAAEVADVELKARLVAVVGKILEETSEEGVQRPAIQALGVLGDPEGFCFLRGFLMQRNPDENPPLLMDAIDAAAKMKADASVPVLMGLARTSGQMSVATAAVRAFSRFGRNKATREEVAFRLIDLVQRAGDSTGRWWSIPGRPPPCARWPDADRRHYHLAIAMVETLNGLTGRDLSTTAEWFALAYKLVHKPSDLFTVRLADDEKPDPRDVARALEVLNARVSELDTGVTRHVERKDQVALGVDARKALTLSCRVAEPALKARLAEVIGKILAGTSQEAVRRSAIQALGVSADPRSFRLLREFLAQPKADEAPPLLLDALAAASQMKSDESVPLLLALVQDSRELTITAAAIRAFSTFGDNKKTRVEILASVIATVQRDQPKPKPWTGSPRPPPTPEEARFSTLAPVMADTLNEMTGQSHDARTWLFIAEDSHDLGYFFLNGK